MTTAFPGAIDAPTTKVDGVTDVLASHVNDLQDGMVALETAIGQEGNTHLCEGRLTGTTGVPVTTADLTTITSIKFTPYNGSRLALHNGTGWITKIFTELSLAVPNTTNTIYDAFAYLSAGAPTLEAVAWASASARATALTTLDGVYVKSGATDRRYLGSFRTTGVSGNVADSLTLRYLWNYYNRVSRPLLILYNTSHTYNINTWRQMNAAAGSVDVFFIVGLIEHAIHIIGGGGITWAAGNSTPQIGIGLNNTSSSFNTFISTVAGRVDVNAAVQGSAFPALGYNYISINEIANAAGTAPTFVSGTVSAMIEG
jgi:hypothetical protein